MKRTFLIILLVTIVIGLVGCGHEDVEKKAMEDVKVFANNDLDGINSLIFDMNDIIVDEELKNYFGNKNDSSRGVLANIFSKVTVSINKADDKNIEYKITAPNMENVFAELQCKDKALTEDELLQHINQYANNVEKKEFIVLIPYIKDDNEIKIDYRNELFVNAITGGFIDAYTQLYSNALNEYREGVDLK